jgi:alpha-L-rhamnosidase
VTFAHNAVDLYSDCPSRERAGWLCDSFFTGKVEHFLTGKTAVEDAFLENYRLCPQHPMLPEGALPMCYPADVPFDGKFIPQWNMWYILEVKDYLTERNPSVDRELFRKSVYGILNFLALYENREGLLQNLPSWNFVEWSKANEWVQDVNYPTNFLYAESLDRVGKLFGDESLCDKAEKTRATTIEKSFNGKVFIDNAVKDENGVPRNTVYFSECGQYYAILFGGIDINDEKFAYIKKQVFEGFAEMKENSETFTYVDILPGFYLKMWTLMKLGYKEHLTKMIKDFFGEMIDLTGTLWEYKPTRRKGSYDHGFASYAVVAAHFCDK